MNAMLRIVTLVALVATTVAGVNIQEYSTEALGEIEAINEEEGITAQVTNPDDKVHMKIMNKHVIFGAAFELDDEKTNSQLGIKLNNEGCVFYSIESFGILIIEEPDREVYPKEDSLLLVWILKPEDKAAIMLSTPVFIIPSSVANEAIKNQQHLEQWASANLVELLNPTLKNALETALQSGKFAFDFRLLQELMRLEIYPSEPIKMLDEANLLRFTTRPLVVPESTKNMIVGIVDKFKKSA